MRTAFNDKAIIKHQDQIGIADRAQPVSYHDTGTGKIAQILINDVFCNDVQITGCFI